MIVYVDRERGDCLRRPKKKHTEIHLHTDMSNSNIFEVVNNYKQYIDKAAEMGMDAIAFTEHGNVLSWYNKKIYAESKGLKYIHGSEVYVTLTFEEKKRDNYHMILLAKNFEGFKELNKMVSTGFERDDKHYYYNPRISWEDVMNTSDNIIITTACLGGVLWQLHKGSSDKAVASKLSEVVQWFADNKERVFLEVQPHDHPEQIQYNKLLSTLSKKTGIRLVAGGDTHALTPEHDAVRKIIQKAKGLQFSDEDSFDLSMKTDGKMIEMFKAQNALSDDEIIDAMDNTNVIADMVETWEVDYSKKYPQMHDDPEKVFNQKIAEGIKYRGIDKLPPDQKKAYAERIKHEVEVYKANDAINYMLLEDEVKLYARSKNVRYGFGRGSVTGSIVAYLMRITEMNSIDRNLNFARFMSKERISLADIDTDYDPLTRHIVQDYLINHPRLSCNKIITYNRMEMSSGIKTVGKGMGMDKELLESISAGYDDNPDHYRSEYPELFKNVDLVKGTITSIGAHACFDKDTLVQTIDGYRKISEVSKGDLVLTHNNRFKPVVDNMVTKSDDLYLLKHGASIPLDVTGNHPMYVRKMKRVKGVKNGKKTGWKEYSNPEWKNVEDINVGEDWIGIAVNQESIIPSLKGSKLPFNSKDFWWFVGRYLGDGWTEEYKRGKDWTERRIIVCCDKKDDEENEISNRLGGLFDYRVEEGRTTRKFFIYSKDKNARDELFEYLQGFGRYAHGKRLNGDILNLPADLLESFLVGYFSADGSFNKKTNVQSFKTVSKELALGVSACVNKVYKRHCVFATIDKKVEVIEGRTVQSKKKYNVTFTKDTRSKERHFYENGYIWSRVSSVESVEGEKDMYNLTVLDDSSYTVNNAIAHNCGIAVSELPLDEYMGIITVVDKKTKEVVTLTQINMKEIDAQNFVKLDVLGLDTMGLLSETVDLAGLEWDSILPENIDGEDSKVWESILYDNTGIFQYESDFAHQIYKDLFSKETIARIKERNPNFSYIDLFSLGNAILRPTGASYRGSVVQGEFYDNGNVQLNEFLAPTLGRLVYQENIIDFLTDFCGYSGGEADVIRRAIGKKQKDVLDRLLPEIKQRFIDYMTNTYSVEREKSTSISEPFMQTILDASDYGFSINHSDAYSWLGYACAYLRYYYPLEFTTASLNINIGKDEKTNNLLNYAKSQGFEIKPIQFRYSKAGYMFDKESKSIYQGVAPIKFLNAKAADALYALRDNQYDSFVDLLIDIKDGKKMSIEMTDGEETIDILSLMAKELTVDEVKHIAKLEKDNTGITLIVDRAVPINSNQLKILISLNYFQEFGGNKKLLKVFEKFSTTYKTTVKIKTKRDRYAQMIEFENSLEDETLSLVEQAMAELSNLGHVIVQNDSIDPKTLIVTELKKFKNQHRVKAYQFNTGEIREFKIGSSIYNHVPFEETDVIQLVDVKVKSKKKKIGDSWIDSGKKEVWLSEIRFIKKGDRK